MSPSRPLLADLPDHVDVVIEVTRGSRVKWGADGGVDFLSPVRCPFNYGSVPAVAGADGDPADAVVLGPGLPRGSTHRVRLWGRVRFLDGGRLDDKWICGTAPPSRSERADVERFFARYARLKQLSGPLRRAGGASRSEGVDWRVPEPER